MPKVRMTPRVFAEYNHASGDRNPTDGRRGTFDQLYPTGHDKLGLSDQVGWRNINHARAGLDLKPAARWQLTGSYHSWWLASATDALTTPPAPRSPDRAAARRGVMSGRSSTRWPPMYSTQLQINSGLGTSFRRAPKNTTPGHSYTYPRDGDHVFSAISRSELPRKDRGEAHSTRVSETDRPATLAAGLMLGLPKGWWRARG
jgi:hypothetical protein